MISLQYLYYCLHETALKCQVKTLHMPHFLTLTNYAIFYHSKYCSTLVLKKKTPVFSDLKSEHWINEWFCIKFYHDFFSAICTFSFTAFLSFPHFLHKSFLDCLSKLFKIPNTRSSPAFLPIQFKLREGQRYNLKYKMTNHVREFQNTHFILAFNYG